MPVADLIGDGLRAARQKDTESYAEQYIVTGLVSADDREKMEEALGVSPVPAIGETHPSNSAALCINVEAAPSGVNGAIVTASFEVPTRDSDNPLLDTTGVARFNGGVVSEQTTFDNQGNLMIATWNGTLLNIFPDGPNASPLTLTPIGRAQKQVPTFGFTLDRRETSIGSVAALAFSHVGRLNNALWPPSGEAGPSGLNFPTATVLCTGIELENINTGETRASYQFEYKANGWSFEVVAKLYERIPDNIDNPPGNGIAKFEIYEEVDFAALPVKL